MTTLHPVQVLVLRQPGWILRVWLATVIILAMAMLPLPIAGLVLWLAALPYMMMMETVAVMLGEHHRALREAVEERKRLAPQLAEREARIAKLEADLTQTRSGPPPRAETAHEALYRQLGLHPRAPEFLLVAARRAFRAALHPDRHPRHRQHAHDRFVRAEAAFDQIEADRRC